MSDGKGRRLPSGPHAGHAAAWFGLLAAVQCSAVAAAPLTAILGHPRTDTLKHLWTLWWARAAPFGPGNGGLHTQLVNFPEGLSVFPIEPLPSALAFVLAPVPLALLVNLLTWAQLVLTGLSGALLGRKLAGHWQGGLMAGTLLQTSAVTAQIFALGVGELQQLWVLPVLLTLQLRALETGTLSAWVRLGLGLAFGAVACMYYGLFAGLMVACVSAAQLVTGPDRARFLLHNVVAVVVLGLALAPFAALFTDAYAVAAPPTPDCAPVYDNVDARLELWTAFWPRGFDNDPPASAYLGGTFLGWGALALGVVGLVRAPRRAAPFAAAAALGLVLALGSYLSVDGAEVVDGGARTVLPMRALNGLLASVAEPINFPVRAVVVCVVALAGLAALALPSHISPRAARVTALAALLPALDPLLLGQAQWPLPVAPLRSVPAVADDAVPGPVADLRLAARPDVEGREAALLLQLAHGQPTQGVPISRLAEAARGGQRQVEALQTVAAIRAQGDISPSVVQADAAVLWGLGFRAVSWAEGWDTGDTAPVPQALSAALGAPIVDGGGFWIWPLPAPAPSLDLAALTAAHASAVAAAAGAEGAAAGSLAAVHGSDECPGRRPQRSDLGLLRRPPFSGAPGDRVRMGGVAAWSAPPPNPADHGAELTLLVQRLPDGGGAGIETLGAMRLERPGPFSLEVTPHAGTLRLSILRGGGTTADAAIGMLEVAVEGYSRDDLHIHLQPER